MRPPLNSLEDVHHWRANEPPIPRFHSTGPFEHARRHAAEHDCDLSVPNGAGLGNVICFTPLVEALARRLGRRLRLLTAPLSTLVPSERGGSAYPVWENNPYVGEIVNADEIDHRIMQQIRAEQNNLCQFGHFIENVCLAYGLIPRALRPSLFLHTEEQARALDWLAELPRPVVCVHAGGSASSPADSPWFLERWRALTARLVGEVSFVQVGRAGFDQKELGIASPRLRVREMMAVIWASDLFVGFDSAPAHVATAFQRPALVLFDVRQKSIIEDRHHLGFAPASMLRWSYPQNRNLMILGEKDEEVLHLCAEFIRAQAASFDHQR
jgi:hypothetical protein